MKYNVYQNEKLIDVVEADTINDAMSVFFYTKCKILDNKDGHDVECGDNFDFIREDVEYNKEEMNSIGDKMKYIIDSGLYNFLHKKFLPPPNTANK